MAGQVSSHFAEEEGAVMSDINVTPLVDVVLVLLIVFMITVPAIVGSTPIRVDLPETGMVREAPSDKLPIELTLRREGNGKLVLFRSAGAEAIPTNEQELRVFLSTMSNVAEEPVSLSADRDIAYGDVVKVMDQLSGLGLHKLSLNTKHVAGANQ